MKKCLLIIVVCVAAVGCADVNAKSRIRDDTPEGEALYSMNLQIAKAGETSISASIFSQELSSWKTRFIKSHGEREWRRFRASIIKKYGYAEELRWFLG